MTDTDELDDYLEKSPSAGGMGEAVEYLVAAACILASLSLLYLDLADPDFGEIASGYMRDVRAVIIGTLRQAAECANLSDPDLQRRARTVQSLFHGAILTWALDGDGILTERVSEALDELFDAWRHTTPTMPGEQVTRRGSRTS